MSIDPLKGIYHAISNNIKPNTLIEIEQNPFSSDRTTAISINNNATKLGPRILNVYMAVLWNPGGQTVILKRNTTIGYVGESDYGIKPSRPMRKGRQND